ncbi:uncharacterized protein LOC142322684 [Lycorma delicatula]|uniref:uncharacterized protein LOC142322684 n=1 Tax=Lycorma delicatula TaxID=130591 RepID=UPI003F50DB7D
MVDRFQNERVIIESHVKALFDIPKIESESCVNLRSLLDSTNIHLRALKTLKQPTDLWDTLLVHLLTSKLDINTNKAWQSQTPTQRIATLALLDPGSSINIISEPLCQNLKLQHRSVNMSIGSVGNIHTTYAVTASIKSRYLSYENQLEFVVLPKITNILLTTKLNISDWAIPKRLFMADPSFNKSPSVQMLIGAEIFYELLCVGQIKLKNGHPFLQKTVRVDYLGRIPGDSVTGNTFFCTEDQINNKLENFWNLEEIDNKQQRALTKEEAVCDKLFVETIQRTDSGRFVVTFPTKSNVLELSLSIEIALRRFNQLEKILSKDLKMKKQYCKFIQDFESLNHMERIDSNTIKNRYYFIPHHCVIKNYITTTKLRVVFDASCKTENKLSLNDCLMNGPVVQEDLFSVVACFQKHVCYNDS